MRVRQVPGRRLGAASIKNGSVRGKSAAKVSRPEGLKYVVAAACGAHLGIRA